MQTVCVHADSPYNNEPAIRCGKSAFTRRNHGYLCIGHYRQQQEAIPPKPRKPQERWKGWKAPQPKTDTQVIAEIIATDTATIAAGNVQAIRCGVIEPLFLRVLLKERLH